MATVPQQEARITQCLGNLYCKISNKEAIGKDTDADWCTYKKLFLMLMISPYVGYSCDFDCFLNANCNC